MARKTSVECPKDIHQKKGFLFVFFFFLFRWIYESIVLTHPHIKRRQNVYYLLVVFSYIFDGGSTVHIKISNMQSSNHIICDAILVLCWWWWINSLKAKVWASHLLRIRLKYEKSHEEDFTESSFVRFGFFSYRMLMLWHWTVLANWDRRVSVAMGAIEMTCSPSSCK